MPTPVIFLVQLVLGYAPWLLLLGAYGLPWLKSVDRLQAQRAIAALHSFRFFGLVFILPGVVGPDLPASFATSAAYGDLAASALAMLALLAVKKRPLFWLLVAAFNAVGVVDLVMNYAHAIQAGVPAAPGELGAAYAIPVLYVPLLMITHVAAVALMARSMGRRRAGTTLHA